MEHSEAHCPDTQFSQMQQVPAFFKLIASTILGRVVSEKLLYRDEIEAHRMKKSINVCLSQDEELREEIFFLLWKK